MNTIFRERRHRPDSHTADTHLNGLYAGHFFAEDFQTADFKTAAFRAENAAPPQPSWHVLWTHSNYERAVYEELSAKGYELFFARIDQWIADSKGKHLARVPMFRSYLFINHAVGKFDYIDICNTKGMVRILGDRWDRLAAIPEQEINDIKRLCSSDTPVSAHPFLNRGDKVRMTRGTLKNTEGILVRNDQHTGLLVVSVALLNRSVAVEVNCTDVVPI